MFQISNFKFQKKGQSLIEIVIALAVGVLLIGGVTTLIGVNLRSSYDTKTVQTASSFAQEIIDQTKSVAESDWHKIYNIPTKGSTGRYYISSSTLNVVAGTETVTADGKNFQRYFYVENASRTKCGIGDITSNATTSCDSNFSSAGVNDRADDPLTQKITAVVLLNNNEVVRQIQYLIRSGNAVLIQTDWSGGNGQAGPITVVNNKFDTSTNIDFDSTSGVLTVNLPGGGGGGGGSIDPILGYAWNDIINWIDFKTPGNIVVYNDRLEGYASSSIGYIALNCNSTPNGNVCVSSNFKVSNNGNGNLTGWAWNDGIGWISFDSASAGSSYPYQVTIDPATGEFHGWAWNDNIGWISFNCAETAQGCSYNYKVKTDWTNYAITGSLVSSIFDTGSTDGVTLNSIIWHGDKPSGTNVKFQIASSNNQAGPWSYLGPSGSSVDYYTGSASSSIPINLRNHNNVRYFRYEIFLDSDSSRALTPQVNDVIINYSI